MAQPDLVGSGASPPPGGADGGAGRRAGLAGNRAQGRGVDRRRHGHPTGLERACRLGCRPACLRERAQGAVRTGAAATLVAAPRDTAPLPPGARWVGRADLAGTALQQRRACRGGGRDPRRAGRGTRGRRQGTLGGSWVVPGRRALAARLAGHPRLRRHRTGAAGPAWELSCILRTPTAQGDVYFKAVRDSPLFVNEAVVTRALAALFPDHVPAPLALDAERRWMALADFGAELGVGRPR